MKLQVREDKVVIDGYVNAVERFSKPLKKKNGKRFIEKIMPSVFQRAIEKNNAIKVLLNHNYERELANTKDGTAKLYEDNIGLRAIVEITDSEVIKKAKENKLRGWSFGFICNKQNEEENENGMIERTVRDIDLREVSILDDKKIPAYVGTSIEMRDGEVKEIEFRNGEFEEDSFSNEKNQEENKQKEMTFSQKREALASAFSEMFIKGWLEDFDNRYVYGTIDETRTIYKMAYSIVEGKIEIMSNEKVKVIRGGYQEIRNEVPEQQPIGKVEKINYSEYEERIKKIKEEK